jgi:hypothetical protein
MKDNPLLKQMVAIMTDKQPEALRLADVIDSDFDPDWMAEESYDQIAAELRRLYANNTNLLNALRDCAAWMEDLRASGDAGNWEWEADEYTRAVAAIAEATGEQQ